jgi:hypothetical protein
MPRVLRLLQVHRDDDEEIATCCDEMTAHQANITQETQPRSAPLASPNESSTGEAEFEIHEDTEFSFSPGNKTDGSIFDVQEASPEPLVPVAVDAPSDVRATGFDVYDGADILGESGGKATTTAPVASSYTGSRRPLDNQKAGIVWEEECVETDCASPERVEPEAGATRVTAEHVQNVAEALHDSGASTFFHVEDDGDDVEQPAEQPAAEPDVEESFETRFERFMDGVLDFDAIVVLMEEAVDEARTEALEQLFGGIAPGDREETGPVAVRARLCEAEYMLMCERPGAALDVLTSLRGADLTEEQRKATWLKTVACQRMQSDFEAANSTLEQLVDLYPDCPEVTRLAKQNYRDYLHNQCAEATVLEKVTSLERDS